MTRLIDADALTNKLRIISYPYPNGLMSEPGVLLKDIEKTPTADAVPVIRCKDCIHNVSNRITDPLCINDYSGDDIVCDYFETDGMEPDDYCSYAERKEE